MNTMLKNKRLSKTYLIGKVLAVLPYVRCVILNGSLASGGHKQSSDIDILIIAKDGRIFTARFFVNFLTIVFGIKRSKNRQREHSGKFCFNYFLTESFLKIPTGRGEKIDRYCADNYSKSMFVAGDRYLFNKFLRINKELFNIYNCRPRLDRGSRKMPPRFRIQACLPAGRSGMTVQAQRFWEIIFGNRFEQWAKKYQIKKIESDPRTKKYPTLIVFSDKELRFHPPKAGSK